MPQHARFWRIGALIVDSRPRALSRWCAQSDPRIVLPRHTGRLARQLGAEIETAIGIGGRGTRVRLSFALRDPG